MPAPTCPIQSALSRLIPEALLPRLSPLELGTCVQLIETAWLQEPPCTLDGCEDRLAALVGLTASQWQSVRARVLLVFDRRHDGRLVATKALDTYQRLAEVREAQVNGGRSTPRGPRGRPRSGRPEVDLRLTSGRPDHGALSFESAPAPLRPSGNQIESERPSGRSNPGAQIHHDSEGGAGARAQEPEIEIVSEDRRDPTAPPLPDNPMLAMLERSRREIVTRLLLSTHWPWAGPKHRTFPKSRIPAIVYHRNASIRQVEWAIAWADQLGTDTDALQAGFNPVGRVISAVEKNREPDLWWRSKYDADPETKGNKWLRLYSQVKAEMSRAAGK